MLQTILIPQDVPGCEDVVPDCKGGVTYFVPADRAFDTFFATFDANTAQVRGRKGLGRCFYIAVH